MIAGVDMKNKIRMYEEMSFNSHPSLKADYYDGWILKYSNGYTKRANSVGAIYESTIALDEKIDYCENYYARLNEPCVFKVTEADKELDDLLSKRQYKLVAPTDLMSMPLKDKAFELSECIFEDKPSKEWLDAFFEYEGYTEEKTKKTATAMLNMIAQEAIYCRIEKDGKVIACGSSVIERGYMSLLNIVVGKDFRGQGYGKKICQCLLNKAIEMGAHTAYLQVVQGNTPAPEMYEALGYKKEYTYWYRVAQ